MGFNSKTNSECRIKICIIYSGVTYKVSMRTGTQSVDNVNGLQWKRRKESTPQLESF